MRQTHRQIYAHTNTRTQAESFKHPVVQLGALVCLHSRREEMRVYAGGEKHLRRTSCCSFPLVGMETVVFISFSFTHVHFNRRLAPKQECVKGGWKTNKQVCAPYCRSATVIQVSQAKVNFVTAGHPCMFLLLRFFFFLLHKQGLYFFGLYNAMIIILSIIIMIKKKVPLGYSLASHQTSIQPLN